VRSSLWHNTKFPHFGWPGTSRNAKLAPARSLIHRSGVLPEQIATTRLFSSLCIVSSSSEQPQLTHIDPITGRPAMVNVSSKESTLRTATARGHILVPSAAFELITGRFIPSATPQEETPELQKAKEKARLKGDVLAVAQLAGIMASKRTADLIPLCHPLALSHVSVTLTPCPATKKRGPRGMEERDPPLDSVLCEATVSCEGKTGVEMEALNAVSIALLTVWDMLKAVAGTEMIITGIHVSRKSGGKSGDFERPNLDHM
jgi:molybdenum cofactor biosynthesis protein MoaC